MLWKNCIYSSPFNPFLSKKQCAHSFSQKRDLTPPPKISTLLTPVMQRRYQGLDRCMQSYRRQPLFVIL
eukprot:scaffold1505_cov146-Skeletonema_marinoi.AAC.23